MRMPYRLSTLFLRTLREDPADAEVDSHKLLVRAGYIRRAGPGIWSWLPLGLMVKNKIEKIVREEMAAAGSQEVHFPGYYPRSPMRPPVAGRNTATIFLGSKTARTRTTCLLQRTRRSSRFW